MLAALSWGVTMVAWAQEAETPTIPVEPLSAVTALGGSDTLPGFPELSEAIIPRPRVFTLPRTLRVKLTLKFE